MSRYALLLLLASFDVVRAHGYLTVPTPRPTNWAETSMGGHTSASASYRWNEPTHTLAGPMTHSSHTRLRGGARMRTGKTTSNATWAAFPRSHILCGWYCLGVAVLGAFGLLWPGNWKKSDSIEFALIGLVLMSLDAVLDAFVRKN